MNLVYIIFILYFISVPGWKNEIDKVKNDMAEVKKDTVQIRKDMEDVKETLMESANSKTGVPHFNK